MSHIEYKQLVAYVTEEIDEAARQIYEQHLETCDLCLERYMQAIEASAETFPKLADDFTETVVNYVREHTKPKEHKKQSIFQKSFFHYAVAAAMTLLLMVSGIFGQLTQVASSIEEKAEAQSTSFTEELMNKTLSFLEEIDRIKEAK